MPSKPFPELPAVLMSLNSDFAPLLEVMVALPAVLCVEECRFHAAAIGSGVAGCACVKESCEPAIVDDDVAGRARVFEVRATRCIIGDRGDPGGVRIEYVECAFVDHSADN